MATEFELLKKQLEESQGYTDACLTEWDEAQEQFGILSPQAKEARHKSRWALQTSQLLLQEYMSFMERRDSAEAEAGIVPETPEEERNVAIASLEIEKARYEVAAEKVTIELKMHEAAREEFGILSWQAACNASNALLAMERARSRFRVYVGIMIGWREGKGGH